MEKMMGKMVMYNPRTVLLLENWEGGYITTIFDGRFGQVTKMYRNELTG